MPTKLTLDNQEREILELLQKDASLSVGKIAERIGLSKSACWRRIQQLVESGVICDRVTLLNQKLLNLNLTVYIYASSDQYDEQLAEEFKELVQGIPEILEVHRVTGDKDFLIKAVVEDMSGYTDMFKKLSGLRMMSISSTFVMESLKQTTQLPLTYVDK